MAEKFYLDDSAEHLKTEEDIAMYVEAAMEEAGDDPASSPMRSASSPMPAT